VTGPVLVLLEHDRGELADAALEALTAARALGDQLGAEVTGVAGVLVGCEADEAAFEAAAAEAGRHGAAVSNQRRHRSAHSTAAAAPAAAARGRAFKRDAAPDAGAPRR